MPGSDAARKEVAVVAALGAKVDGGAAHAHVAHGRARDGLNNNIFDILNMKLSLYFLIMTGIINTSMSSSEERKASSKW